MAIYRGAETMGAERAQSLWNIGEGKKRHDKATLDQFGNRALASAFGDIIKTAFPGYGHVAELGIDQLSQKMFKLPEYEEEGGSFWGSKFISKYKEEDEAVRSEADTSLLEGIIRGTGDYIGVGTDKPKQFDLEKFMSTGRGGDVAEAGGLFSSEGIGALLGFMKNGGRVPKYYGGGSVSGSPTIAGYFSQQGKTLGGSNTQSLAEKLGR